MRLSAAFAIICFSFAAVAQAPASLSPLASINSALDEQAPVLSPDGNTLYFTISNHPQNIGGKRDLGDIWYATKTETGWSAPVHGGNLLNNSLHNTVAGFSADGMRLYLMGHYAEGGQPITTQGIAVSNKTAGGWSKPLNISIPHFRNTTPYQSGAISFDESVLVFSAESYATLGAEDIYVSIKQPDGRWAEPKNMGKTVNTTAQDVSPWLDDTNMRLYFASNGHGGKGSFDIFYCDRQDDTWQNWSAPKPVEAEVNSEGRELFFRKFGTHGFFTSTHNSDGYGDVRAANMPEASSVTKLPADSVVTIEEVVPPAASDKLVRVRGAVKDRASEKPLAASLLFHGQERFEAVAASDGLYQSALPTVAEYTVTVSAPGYVSTIEKLDLRTVALAEVELNFLLQPIAVGTTVNLKNVLFEQSKAVLLAESFDELDMVVDFMKANPTVEIELAGHTDNRGYSHLNQKLSKERVEEVKRYLVDRGVSATRIAGRGYGSTRPIADNDGEESRKLNRRVEFVIVKR
jgi:outer membrane protein OmpA-like peptidoglycan-associated protein